MYQALYRKWRPRTFDEVTGQEHITGILKNQVRDGRLSHAYLFVGTRGTGKTTCAKILSRAVNCENPRDGSPCNECKSCLAIESGSALDVVELDAASNNGVDNVRALRDEAVFSPATVKKRVYIIDEVHMLSTSAFNALLKILEEPPEHLMFILATTELHKVPATILSRCQRHSFRRIGPELIAERLSFIAGEEHYPLQPDAARLLARLADGAMRDALSLLDQCSGRPVITAETVLEAVGLIGSAHTVTLREHITAGDTEKALELFDKLWRDGKNPSTLLAELCSLDRDILITHVAPKGGAGLLSGAYDDKALGSLRKKTTPEALISSITAIQSSMAGMRTSPNPKMLAELCVIGLCEPKLSDDLPTLRARVASLESGAVAIGKTAVRAERTETADEGRGTKGAISELQPEPEPDSSTWLEPEPKTEPKAPKPEPEPEPEPEPQPEPEPESEPMPQRSGEDDAFRDKLLAVIKGRLEIGTFNLLSDSFHTDISFDRDDGLLTVLVKNDFAYMMLSNTSVTEVVKKAASELTDAAVRLEVKKQGAPAARNSVDALGKFGNVKFV